MNWHAIGAIGQILGSLATFVTVGYLVVQVHDTEKEMQRSIAQSRTERTMELGLLLATNERLVSIHNRGNAALVDKPPPPFFAAATKLGLTMDEAISLYGHYMAAWNHTSQSILYLNELPTGEREQFDQMNRGDFAEPLWQFWYSFAKPTLSPEAVRYVDALMAQPR
jgi:hypothetical protein